MSSQGYELARAELIHALTAYTGITTADGAGTNDTLVDTNLIGVDQRKIVEKTILICSGDSDTEDAASVSFVPGNGTITVSPAFSHKILAGTIFRILNISTVELDVVNILARIGTNTDPAGTTTLFAWLASLGALAAGGALEATLTAMKGAGWTVETLKAIHDLLVVIASYIDTEVAAIKAKTDLIPADITTQLDTNVPAIKTQTDKIAGKMLFSMDFWSDMQALVTVTGAQTSPTLPSVTIANLPATATIVRAITLFKFRMVENTFAGVNKLDAAAPLPIQVDDGAGTGYVTAIDFVDDAFGFTAAAREGGDVIIGDNNIASRVDGNDTYPVKWLNAKADQNNLQFNDVQVGLRIWYSI